MKKTRVATKLMFDDNHFFCLFGAVIGLQVEHKFLAAKQLMKIRLSRGG